MQNDNIKEDQLFSLAGQSNERVFSVIRALSWFGLLHAILCTLLWKNEIQWWLPTLPFCVPLGMLICVHRPDHRDWGHWGIWGVCACGWVCVRVFVWVRHRGCVCVCERDTGCMCVCVCVCVCVWVCVCVVCVCV